MAQTTCAHVNHFYKAVLGALEFDGPAIVVCYTTCQPEHGVADNMAGDQARLAVDTPGVPAADLRSPQGRHDQGAALAARQPGREGRLVRQPEDEARRSTFIDFARSEGRFSKHFDNDGNPSETLLRAKQDRLENWHVLQELAGAEVRSPATHER